MSISIKKIFSLLSKRDRTVLVLMLLLMIVASFVEVLSVGTIPVFVSVILSPQEVRSFPIVGDLLYDSITRNEKSFVVISALVLIAAFLLKNVFVYAVNAYKVGFVFDRLTRISVELVKRYLLANYTYHLGRNSAELIRNSTQEVRIALSLVLLPTLTLFMNVLILIAMMAVLLLVNPVVTTATVSLVAIAAGAFFRNNRRRLRQFGKTEQKQRARMINVLNQAFVGLKDIRVLRREQYFIDSFQSAVHAASQALCNRQKTSLAVRPFVETLAIACMLGLIAILVLRGKPVGEIIPLLTLFAAALVKLMPLANEAITNLTNIRYGMASIDAITADMAELKGGCRSVKSSNSHVLSRYDIEFENVTYRYPNVEQKALTDVSFQIENGQFVGIVGASGCGKTTLVDVLLGLLEPQEGQVRIGGVELGEIGDKWSKAVGYVPQSIYLSDNSIVENVAFGIVRSDIDERRVWDALVTARLSDFVESLPSGLETIIGENGARLSGGQRQRIGIARALYNQPKVLVFDEATSALDIDTERSVFESIENLRGKMTILSIAHRLTTVKRCDSVMVLEKGNLLGKGDYHDLLCRYRIFQNLASVQDSLE